jgi:hypothetical protein
MPKDIPSPLRFRAPQSSKRSQSTSVTVPRTPKSPYGVYTGSPVPPVPSGAKQTSKHRQRVLFAVLFFAILASLALFTNRHRFIPDFPLRSSVYWRNRSASHAASKSDVVRPAYALPDGQVKAIFADQPAFQSPGPNGDRAWLRMFPKGDRRVAVWHPRKYGLPTSAAALDEHGDIVHGAEVFEVGVIKQLECLVRLYWPCSSYQDARANLPHAVLPAQHPDRLQ